MDIKYLSPTSINQWHADIEEFFLQYVVRVPRAPQTEPMAIGSAFDSCIKAYLVAAVVEDGEYDKKRHIELYEKYFEETVEPHLRDWAYPMGILIFNMYKETGALKHLIMDVEPGTLQPLEKVETTYKGIPLLGKPDLLWISKAHGCKIVDDWKCNGACSKHNKSPNPGYIDLFPSRAMHKNCLLVDGVNAMEIHKMYALQLTIYKILTGAEIVGINQLVFGACEPPTLGELRVALHRHRISDKLMTTVERHITVVWECVTTYEPGGSFGTIPPERCEQLLKQGEILSDPLERMLAGR